MGASGSRGDGGEVTTGDHSSLPEDRIPYKGPQLECTFMDIKAVGTTFMGRYLKTDLTPHYGAFSEPYANGFQMVQLKRIPGVQKKLHVQYGLERRYYTPFQAVFVKPTEASAVPTGRAKIIQVSIEFTDGLVPTGEGVIYAKEVAHLSAFNQTIATEARSGFRLVSFDASCYFKRSPAKNVKETSLVMELVFHQSMQPDRGPSIYQSIVIPVSFTTVRQMKLSRRRIYGLVTNVSPQIQSMLQLGWKIVDVTYLSSHLQGVFSPNNDTVSFNTMWVFEMAAEAADDIRQRWECSVIKYSHVVKMVANGTKAATSWNPIIVEMGHRGWELACILDTAESNPSGWRISQTLLLVFQRPVPQ